MNLLRGGGRKRVTRWAALPMARPAGLEVRLRSLLEPHVRRDGLRRTTACVAVCVTAGARLALNVFPLREASAKATPLSQTSAATGSGLGSSASARDSEFARVLPGGVNVSLIEVSAPLSAKAHSGAKLQQSYWKPDGTRSAASALDDSHIVGVLAGEMGFPSSTENDHKFSFLFAGLSDDQKPIITRTNGLGFDVVTGIGSNGANLETYACKEPVGQREESFRIGVPTAKWTTETRIDIAQVPAAGQMAKDMRLLDTRHGPPRFLRAYRSDSTSVTFTVLFGVTNPVDAAGLERKVSLLDRNGMPLTPAATGTGTGRNYTTNTIDFSKSAAQRAAFLLIETRSTTFVTIDHVALQPKGNYR